MNKTIIININGIVFHIEEDAYDVLRSYMIDVKKHFGHSADSHEIVGDIENRIAEMFSERIEAGKKEVITMQDVQEVIEQMGRVSEFAEEEAGHASYTPDYTEAYKSTHRKFMRDPDDRVFGGVASGIGHYFGIEPRWIRLIFIILFLTAGTGLLVYLILWIVVPVAKTRADRMAMRGEAANIRNFKRSFQEEMEGLRTNFTDAGSSGRDTLVSAGKVITNIFIVLAKVIGVIFIFGICVGLIVLVVSIFATFGFLGQSNDMAMFSQNIIPEEYISSLLISALIVVIIPLIALISLITRILFNKHLIGKYSGFILLAIWLVAIGMTTMYGVETATDFREESTLVQERPLEAQPIYRLALNDLTVIKLSDSLQHEDRLGDIRREAVRRNSRLMEKQRRISLQIVKLDSAQQAGITYEFSARGKTYEIAAERAGKIQHHLQQDGELILLDSHFYLDPESMMRDQDVNIRLNIPVGTQLFIDRKLERYVWQLPARQCRQNYKDHDGSTPTETQWIMTTAGLKCAVSEQIQEEDMDDNR